MKATLLLGSHLRRRYPGSLYATGAEPAALATRRLRSRARRGRTSCSSPRLLGCRTCVAAELPLSAGCCAGGELLANTYPTDMTGHPALSLPLAEAEGLPVGVMLVGRHGDDARLLALGRTVERTLGWRPEPGRVAVRAAVPDP